MVRENESVFSVGFGYHIWKRYLVNFDELIASTRMHDNNKGKITINTSNMKLSNGRNVVFKPIDKYRSMKDLILNFKGIYSQVEEALEEADCAIIRLPSLIGLIACRAARKMEKPWLLEIVGCPLDSLLYHGKLSSKLLALPFYFLNKYYIEKSDYVIYVTKTYLQRRYPSSAETVNISNVEVPYIDEQVLNKRIIKIKNQDKEVKLGLIGALNVNYKGHDTALRALASIKNEVNFKLVLLGSGSNERIKQISKVFKIEDRVIFSGTLPSGEPVFNWMDEIDILLVPSLTEGLPRSVVEAMSRGCPVIGSRVGGIIELLDSKMLHKSKDYNGLAKIISELFNNKSEMIIQAQKNFNNSKEYLNDKLNAKRVDFFKEFSSSIDCK